MQTAFEQNEIRMLEDICEHIGECDGVVRNGVQPVQVGVLENSNNPMQQ
jgi:hypothetical protein